MVHGSEGWQGRFWDTLCDFYSVLWGALALTFTLFILSLLLFPFVKPGSGSHAILIADIAVLGVTLTGLSIILYGCYRRIDL
jgi:hypothetical protein